MAENKKSFVLYCDIIHTVTHLTDEQAGILFKHILDYVNDKNPETEDVIIKLAFEPIKQILKRDLKKWEGYIEKQRENGLKGGRPNKAKETQITQAFPENPVQPKKADSVSVSVNVNDNANTNTIPSEMWDGIKLKWKSDWRWIDKTCMDNGNLDRLLILKRMDEFLGELDSKEDFKDVPGLKKHFFHWYKKYHNGSAKNNGNSTTGNSGTKLGTSDARVEALRKW